MWSSRTLAPPRDPQVLDWALVIATCLFGGLVALMAFFYLPLYIDAVPFPVTVLAVGVAAWGLPRLCYRLTGSVAAAAAPAVAMFVVTVVLTFSSNSLLPLLPPRIVLQPWRLLLFVGVLVLVAAASISLTWADKTAARIASVAEPAGPENPNVTPVTSLRADAPDQGRAVDTGTDRSQ